MINAMHRPTNSNTVIMVATHADSYIPHAANIPSEITNKLLHKPTIEMRKALQSEDEERIKLLKSLITADPH